MARRMPRRKFPRPQPTCHHTLSTIGGVCVECRGSLLSAYYARRTLRTLDGVMELRIQVRHCLDRGCRRYRRGYRAEEEGSLALPDDEFGLDVIALVGALRYQQHRSVPEIHRDLQGRGVAIGERTVTNLLDRYDEL